MTLPVLVATGAAGPEYRGLRRHRHTAVKAELGLRPEDQRRFRLAELAQRMGKAAYLIDDASDIQEAWVKDAACVGVTAGASAPDILVQNVITRLQELGGGEAVPLEGREENIVFEVPKELRVDVREVE